MKSRSEGAAKHASSDSINRSWWARRSIGFQSFVVGLFTLFAVSGLFWLLAWAFTGTLTPWRHTQGQTVPKIFELIMVAAIITALLWVSVLIAVLIRKQMMVDESVRYRGQALDNKRRRLELDAQRSGREETDRLRDRYTVISAQLGDKSAPVRLAGVYAMATLADEWLHRKKDAEAQVCIDVLCAYLRTPERANQVDGARETFAEGTDRAIRQSITRVINDHLQPDAKLSWATKNFDFSGVSFAGNHSFEGAIFSNGGKFNFENAVLESGSVVSFRNAQFNDGSNVNFEALHLADDSDLNFSGANFNKGSVVYLGRTIVDGGARLYFSGSEFNDGTVVYFTAAEFREASATNFRSAKFATGSRVYFNGAEFQAKSHVSFALSIIEEGARLSLATAALQQGCSIDFSHAKLADSFKKHFPQVKREAVVTGPWEQYPIEKVWVPEPVGE